VLNRATRVQCCHLHCSGQVSLANVLCITGFEGHKQACVRAETTESSRSSHLYSTHVCLWNMIEKMITLSSSLSFFREFCLSQFKIAFYTTEPFCALQIHR